MANLREIAFDIDFAKKKAYNNQDITLEELTQNDHNSSVLVLRLLQDEQPIDLTGITVVLNFLLPDGSDYKIDIAQSHNINTRTSLVTYSIPKMVLSQVGVVIGTVSLYKAGYRYTSIVQFKFEVVEDIVNDGEIVDSENYPILVSMISDINMIHADEECRKVAEECRVNAELERIEAEEERETSEATRTLSELERQESEEGRVLAESNRELLESERQKAELLRIASISEMEANEMIRVEGESLRVSSELERKESELNRANAESVRAGNEANRMSSEESRCKAEEDRVNAELLREQKQNEFNARAEEVAVRIEEESQRISDLVEIEESKLVKPRDMMDYMGNQHNSLKEKADSDVDYAVKTAIGEFNYLDYEGQHITATNSIEGHARSAILKGNTLVNLQPKTRRIAWGVLLNDNPLPTNCAYDGFESVLEKLKPSTKYIMKFTKPISDKFSGTYFAQATTQVGPLTNDYRIITTLAELTTSTTPIHIYPTQGAFATRQELYDFLLDLHVMVIEYQDGMENWDIPYFEGMQSVRMPVLKTTGKNLFDRVGTNANHAYCAKYEWIGSDLHITTNGNQFNSVGFTSEIKAGEYTLSISESAYIKATNLDNNSILFEQTLTTKTFKVLNDCKIRIDFFANLSSTSITTKVISNIQLERGTQSTPYEPYKSNILSVNEDVTLRGIGDVRDELDLLTGDMTQRIGEIVLDGSEDEVIRLMLNTTNHIKFTLPYNGKPYSTSICSSLNRLVDISSDAEGYYCGTEYFGDISDYGLMLSINKSKLTTPSVDGLKVYLSQNPITIQYQLATESIKTVDLSDNTVYSYDGTTHYSCSSEDGSLVPTLSVKVPTDVQATIAQQRNTIVALEAENEALKEGQMLLESGHEQQEGEIISTQDAVNFLLFGEVGLMMLRLQEEQSKEMDKMAVYIANQILKRKVSYELAVSKYPQFKEDIDSILIMEGREDLIQG